jgi:hypothetical protein
MNKKMLLGLKEEGYTYLLKKHNDKAYHPYKGKMKNAIENLSNKPLEEDIIISIDEAIKFADTEGLKTEMIVLKK